MPISENEYLNDACSGGVAAVFQDLNAIQDQIEAFLHENLPLCVKYLPGFKDGTIAKKSEKDLAVSLWKRLNAFGFEKNTLFTFFNEDPDIKKKNRTVDSSVNLDVGNAYIKVGPHYYDCEDQLYIIEAKRLPPQFSGAGQEDRSHEYVVSDWEHRNNLKKSRTGGIERFKEGLHGGAFVRSAMVAFVQKETPQTWLEKINSWVNELIAKAVPCHKAKWTNSDLLVPVSGASHADLAVFQSNNPRSGTLNPISLRHFWLLLARN